MAKVFSLQAFRRDRDKEAAVIPESEAERLPVSAASVPNISTGRPVLSFVPGEVFAEPDDESTVLVGRRAVRDDLAALLWPLDEVCQGLSMLGVPLAPFAERRAALQSVVEEVYGFCPPSSKPYSPCAADSRATITQAQWKKIQQLKEDLRQLGTDMGAALTRVQLSF